MLIISGKNVCLSRIRSSAMLVDTFLGEYSFVGSRQQQHDAAEDGQGINIRLQRQPASSRRVASSPVRPAPTRDYRRDDTSALAPEYSPRAYIMGCAPSYGRTQCAPTSRFSSLAHNHRPSRNPPPSFLFPDRLVIPPRAQPPPAAAPAAVTARPRSAQCPPTATPATGVPPPAPPPPYRRCASDRQNRRSAHTLPPTR